MTNKKLTIKNLNKIKFIMNGKGDEYFKFNKIRHEETNYETLVPLYNQTGDYMTLCKQVVMTLGPVLGPRYMKVVKKYYTKKVNMNKM